MSELIFLGTGAAVPDRDHHNTHLAFRNASGVVLIDCGSSPPIRLQEAGIGIDEISDLILTHFHPDHVGSLPLLLMNMWLMGRQQALRIYGLHHCLERVEDVMGFYHWEDWPEFFPVAFHRLPERENVQIIERDDLNVFTSPVRHVIPTIGLRLEIDNGRRTVAYSCDTEPCPEVVRLAERADILIHEATGHEVGHSSAKQAAEIASKAGVETVYLVHYPTHGVSKKELLEEASSAFSGNVIVAEDFDRLTF
ncbi:MAG: MBL fold metallo-hydrolase [Anaerolineales bacterium]|jgi:ribonuclease Z